MSEVTLWSIVVCHVQGYFAHKNPPPRRTPQKPYAWGPMVLLGGWVFLMSEVTP